MTLIIILKPFFFKNKSAERTKPPCIQLIKCIYIKKRLLISKLFRNKTSFGTYSLKKKQTTTNYKNLHYRPDVDITLSR